MKAVPKACARLAKVLSGCTTGTSCCTALVYGPQCLRHTSPESPISHHASSLRGRNPRHGSFASGADNLTTNKVVIHPDPHTTNTRNPSSGGVEAGFTYQKYQKPSPPSFGTQSGHSGRLVRPSATVGFVAESLEWRFNNRENPHIFRDTLRRIVDTDALTYKAHRLVDAPPQHLVAKRSRSLPYPVVASSGARCYFSGLYKVEKPPHTRDGLIRHSSCVVPGE